ncbi:MAG: VOC family protein [Rubrivivax sp.]|nr:VOC family protein [Rubrivivax sp.]
MDVYKTHGAFSWSELMTTDPAAAAQFYSALFGWSVKDMGAEMQHYQMASVGDAGVGGIMGMPEGAPPGVAPQWGCYVTVNDVDATLARCAELGGMTLVPPMDVPGVGRMAVLRDPQGAVLNIMAYAAA